MEPTPTQDFLICEIRGLLIAIPSTNVQKTVPYSFANRLVAETDAAELASMRVYELVSYSTSSHGYSTSSQWDHSQDRVAVILRDDVLEESPAAVLVDRIVRYARAETYTRLAAVVDVRTAGNPYLFGRPVSFQADELVWDIIDFIRILLYCEHLGLGVSGAEIIGSSPAEELRHIMVFLKSFHDSVEFIHLFDETAYADLCYYANGRVQVVASSGEAPKAVGANEQQHPSQPIDASGHVCFSRSLRLDGSAVGEGGTEQFARLFLPSKVNKAQATKVFDAFVKSLETVGAKPARQIIQDDGIRSIIDQIEQGILVLDGNLMVLYANKAIESILKISLEETAGRPLEDVVGSVNDWMVERSRDAIAQGMDLYESDAIYFVNENASLSLGTLMHPIQTSGFSGISILITSLEEKRNARHIIDRYIGSGISQSFIETHNFTRRKVSVMFSDVCSFTSIVEALGPSESLPMLNQYFTFMEDVITNNGGTIDKFIGDAVMAVFGMEGIENPRLAASLAVKTALDMFQALEIFNMSQKASGQQELWMRVGIATGEVVLGTIGSSRRSDFSVIGDTVNTAARIVELNKAYKSDIMIDDATKLMNSEPILSRNSCTLALRGQVTKTKIHEVGIKRLDRMSDEDVRFFELYEGTRAAHEAGDLETARIYLEKAQKFRKKDPALMEMMQSI